jgi:voltage-gated potassium channel
MDFFRQAGIAVILVTLTLVIQCSGMAALIDWGIKHFEKEKYRIGAVRSAELIVRFATAMIFLHLSQILLWAVFYRWSSFRSWESAFYFSITSYSTVGYGDLIPPSKWRNLGPMESMTGVLMCGLSASFLFAIVTRLVDRETRRLPVDADGSQSMDRSPEPEHSSVPRRDWVMTGPRSDSGEV